VEVAYARKLIAADAKAAAKAAAPFPSTQDDRHSGNRTCRRLIASTRRSNAA